MSKAGFILINKPKGISSATCVNILRKKIGRRIKVGHAGTLDIPACGLLVLLVGKLTRTSSYIMELPKRYIATIKLGEQTDTDDASGEVQNQTDWKHVKEEDVDSALISFLGHRFQVPPNVSAVSISGRRAYDLAREKKSFDIPPRIVFIQSVKRISPITKEGKLVLEVVCSKGTYMRSLARDLGITLGCYAHVAFLERTDIGPFKLKNAIPLGFIEKLSREELLEKILPPQELLKGFCTCKASELDEETLARGQKLFHVPSIKWWGTLEPSKVFVVEGKKLISFCDIEWRKSGCIIRPVTNIAF